MKTIGGLFGRSPYGPVHEMMLKVQQCVACLPEVLRQHAAGAWDPLDQACAELDRLEGQADDIKREIRKHLSTSLFTSVERSETMDLTHSLDDVADASQDTGKLICMRKTGMPPELVPGFARLAELLVAAAGRMAQVTARLSGSAGERVTRSTLDEVIQELGEVSHIEHDCDVQQHDLQHALFGMEDRLSPMDIFFLMNIIKAMGEVADAMENAADSLARNMGSR